MNDSHTATGTVGDARRYQVLEAILQCPVHAGALTYDAAMGEEGQFRCDAGGHSFDIVDGILDLVVADADAESAADASATTGSVRDRVERWYDEFGWKRTEDGHFADTHLFGDPRPRGYGLYALRSHTSFLDLIGGGGFLLDAGCGGGAHPEYQAYSWFYSHRVCVDISERALLEARRRFGRGAFYVRADLCRLPFQSDRFDGVVSGYVVQHIDADLQREAVSEMYRVVSPGNRVLIMSGVKKSPSHRLVATAIGATAFLARAGQSHRRADLTAEQQQAAEKGADLYYHPRRLAWWRDLGRDLGGWVETRCLRMFKRKEFESMFGTAGGGVIWLRRLEEAMPRLLARPSRYALIAYRKPGA